MSKHPTMTVRAQALAYKDAKMSVATIMSKTGMSNSALHRLFKAAKAVPETLPLAVPTRKAGSGRPPVITALMRRKMKTSLNKNPKLSASELKQKLKCPRSIPVRTIQDVLCRVMGLRSRHTAKKPFLSDAMRQKRLAFARLHVNKSVKWWQNILFTDESNFQLFSSSRFQRVRRARGTNRFDEKSGAPEGQTDLTRSSP